MSDKVRTVINMTCQLTTGCVLAILCLWFLNSGFKKVVFNALFNECSIMANQHAGSQDRDRANNILRHLSTSKKISFHGTPVAVYSINWGKNMLPEEVRLLFEYPSGLTYVAEITDPQLVIP